MDKQGSASADDVALIKRKDSDRSAHPKTTRPAHKRGGPRTQVGKQKSCQNAVKHGVFSKLFLLKGESRSEFDSLLAGLRACYQPEGMLEEALVEKLAVLMWRQRRLLIAESVEIWKAGNSSNGMGSKIRTMRQRGNYVPKYSNCPPECWSCS